MRIFIACRHEDLAQVKALAEQVNSKGHEVHYTEMMDLVQRGVSQRAIMHIHEADLVIVIGDPVHVHQASCDRDWQHGYAYSLRKCILLVGYERCNSLWMENEGFIPIQSSAEIPQRVMARLSGHLFAEVKDVVRQDRVQE